MLATIGEKVSLTKTELTKLLPLLKYHDTTFTLHTRSLVQHNTHELQDLIGFFLLKILHEAKLADELVKSEEISEGQNNAKHEAFKTDSLDILAEIIQENHKESIKNYGLKDSASVEEAASKMYEKLGVLNSLRTLLHFFKLASRPVEENVEELYCLWTLAKNFDAAAYPELYKTVDIHQYHPSSVKVDLGNKFTNWTIA